MGERWKTHRDSCAGQADLLEMVLALDAAGSLALLHGGQQQANQYGDDRNHHQEFNERKSASAE